jgi:Zn-dependent protease with chaperone function
MMAGMNLIAGLSIAICLLVCDLLPAAAIQNCWTHVWAVLIVAALVPAIAFFQTSVLIQRWQHDTYSFDDKIAACRRLSVSHMLVWLSASAATIWVLRWQDVVRGVWQIDRWPLVDEWLILCPILFSMAASWAVFYELQVALGDSETFRSGIRQNSIFGVREVWRLPLRWLRYQQPRWEFVSLRFRLYFLIVLLPVSGFLLVRDLAGELSTLSEFASGILTSLALLGLMLAMPFLMLLIWKNGKIENENLRKRLKQICTEHRLSVFDVRTWHTGRQMINAAVAGWLPGFRIIFLSDGLLNHFDEDEVAAVLRHEAGHLRLWHVPQRMFFLLMPIFAVAFFCGAGQGSSAESFAFEWLNGSRLCGIACCGVALWLTHRWLSHQMEFEADLYAIQKLSTPQSSRRRKTSEKSSRCGETSADSRKTHETSNEPKRSVTQEADRECSGIHCAPDDFGKIDLQQAAALSDALLRLAAMAPGEFDRKTFLHPSIRQRVDFISRVCENQEMATRFQKSFRNKRILLVMLSLLWCAITALNTV